MIDPFRRMASKNSPSIRCRSAAAPRRSRVPSGQPAPAPRLESRAVPASPASGLPNAAQLRQPRSAQPCSGQPRS